MRLALMIGLAASIAQAQPLKPVQRVYLVMHALNWLEIVPGDPRRETATWEQWPGRCELCYAYEQPLKEKYYALLGKDDPEAAVWIVPSGMKGDPPLIELAQKTFGSRCVVCPLGYGLEENRVALGEEFAKEADADRARAKQVRGEVTEAEVLAWERSKGWAVWFTRELAKNGYTFDPQTVQVQVLGEDWCGCAATFPIHMSRALGLKEPIWRRYDLINPDCSPLLIKSTLVDQNLAMPNDIRLLIVRSAEGRFVAQFWEGSHGLWEWPHVVTAQFPPGSVKLVNTLGQVTNECADGVARLSVGCGGHTPHHAQLIMAQPELSREDFRKALLAGIVTEKKE